MKKLPTILVLGLALTHAAAEVPATFVKLVGLSTVPDARRAYLLVLEANRFREVVLAEGKNAGALELVAIDDRAMAVTIRNGGKESVLGFTAEAPPPPARAITGGTGKKTGVIQFQNLPLTQLLDFYSDLTGRTILKPNFLPVGVVAAHGQNLDRDGIVRFLERTLDRAQLQALPQGDKFAVVIPKSLPLPAVALWKARKAPVAKNHNETVLAPNMLALENLEIAQSLLLYGNMSGRKVDTAADLPIARISLKMQTPFTPSEALYALETVLVLNGIQIVAVDDKTVKAVPLTPPVSKSALAAKNKPSLSK